MNRYFHTSLPLFLSSYWYSDFSSRLLLIYCLYNKYTLKSYFWYLFYNHLESNYLDSILFCVFLMLTASLSIRLWFLFLLFHGLLAFVFSLGRKCRWWSFGAPTSLGLFFIIPYENISIVGCGIYGSQTFSPYNGDFFQREV